MYTHNLDPVLLDLGFIAIRWYSLSYIFGIIIGWWLGKKIIKHLSKNNPLRFSIEEFLGSKVHLFLRLKVREKWMDEVERYSEMGLDFRDGNE